jgi:hypothetical protein
MCAFPQLYNTIGTSKYDIYVGMISSPHRNATARGRALPLLRCDAHLGTRSIQQSLPEPQRPQPRGRHGVPDTPYACRETAAHPIARRAIESRRQSTHTTWRTVASRPDTTGWINLMRAFCGHGAATARHQRAGAGRGGFGQWLRPGQVLTFTIPASVRRVGWQSSSGNVGVDRHDSDTCRALSPHADFLSRSSGKINQAVIDERAAIIHHHHDRAIVFKVGHMYLRWKG